MGVASVVGLVIVRRLRPELSNRHAVHVTLRMNGGTALRQGKAYRAVRRVLAALFGDESFRVVHISIQNNHLHLIVEAEPLPVSPPRTSLLRSDWRRYGLIDPCERPGPRF